MRNKANQVRVVAAVVLGASGVQAFHEWAGLHWVFGLVTTGVAAASYKVAKGA